MAILDTLIPRQQDKHLYVARLESWRNELQTNACGWQHVAQSVINELEACIAKHWGERLLMDTNWKGQARHPIDDYCWFRTDDKDRAKMIELYDIMIGDNKGLEVILNKLIDMIRSETNNEAEFDFNGRDDDCFDK